MREHVFSAGGVSRTPPAALAYLTLTLPPLSVFPLPFFLTVERAQCAFDLSTLTALA